MLNLFACAFLFQDILEERISPDLAWIAYYTLTRQYSRATRAHKASPSITAATGREEPFSSWEAFDQQDTAPASSEPSTFGQRNRARLTHQGPVIA